jgi:hypothetical protein
MSEQEVIRKQAADTRDCFNFLLGMASATADDGTEERLRECATCLMQLEAILLCKLDTAEKT